jgi:hypothetical protein
MTFSIPLSWNNRNAEGKKTVNAYGATPGLKRNMRAATNALADCKRLKNKGPFPIDFRFDISYPPPDAPGAGLSKAFHAKLNLDILNRSGSKASKAAKTSA